MTSPIEFPSSGPIGPVQGSQTGAAKPAASPDGRDFKSVLLDNLNEVNRLQQEADQGVQKLLTGQTDNVAEVMAAVNQAGVAFDLLMEIRNQLMDAYQQVQQMRV
jgi:flagellar hook-basal body complex protein FliE